MSERLHAVAKAIADQNGWTSYSAAKKALDAADAATFSEAAVERVAAVLAMKSYTTDAGIAFDDYERVARAVIAALKGDA